MPGEPPASGGFKSSGSHTQTTSHHYVSFRTDVEDTSIPPAIRARLADLFLQIEREFEIVCTENASLHEKIETLNERIERDCYGSGDRSLPQVDFQVDYSDNKNLSKQKSIAGSSAYRVKASQKLKAQTSKIVSSFKNISMNCNMLKEYRGHRDGIWEVSVGKSGQPIVGTASADHTARVWGMDSCRCLLQYTGHNGSVNSIRFHPTIDLALTASGDCTAHVWQAAVNWESQKKSSLEDVASSGCERGNTGNIADSGMVEDDSVPTLRTPIKELIGHTGVVIAADWLYGAEQIVTASWDRTANLYDAESGEIIHTLCGHDQELTHVATHYAQRLCVTSSRDSTFRLWDFRESNHSVSVFQGHTEAVTAAVFTKEDKIVSASDDRSVKVWELRNIRSPLATIRGDSSVNRLAVSSTGIVAIPHDNRQIRLFDLSGQRMARLPRTNRQGHRRMVCSVAWAEENSSSCNLFTCGFDRLVLGWSVLPIKDA